MTLPSKTWPKKEKKKNKILLMQTETETDQKEREGRPAPYLTSVYLPTWVSKRLVQKSVFAATNNIPRRMLRAAMAS